jgi:hypothetical protein
MAVYIGATTFRYSLKWVLKGQPTVVGADFHVRDGDVVSVTPTNVSQNAVAATLKFKQERRATVEALFNMWKLRTTYTMKPEDNDATTYTIRFMADNGVTNVRHSAFDDDAPIADVVSTSLDLWDGEINVLIVG